jgi:DNA-binding HxlR family transcriptional regulator
MGFEHVRSVVGAKRTLDVLQTLSNRGKSRFSELESSVGISSDTLSRSLDSLVEYDLVRREEVHGRNVTYGITKRGVEFLDDVKRLNDSLANASSQET